MGRLDGKVAIVTGGGRGIGVEYAKVLAAEGAKVAVTDIVDTETTVNIIKQAGGEAIGIHCDVTDPDNIKAMVAETVDTYGRLDILVNNAALFVDIPRRTFMDIDSEEWDKVMAVNVRGSFNCSKAVVPSLRKRGAGSIVNISSSTALKGIPFTLHYVTSKGAIIAMTRAMARELGEENIRVNSLAPGLTMSEAVAAADNTFAPYNKASIRGRALKREQVPEDLVGAAIFLASDASAFMTGQTMVVDGGDVTY